MMVLKTRTWAIGAAVLTLGLLVIFQILDADPQPSQTSQEIEADQVIGEELRPEPPTTLTDRIPEHERAFKVVDDMIYSMPAGLMVDDYVDIFFGCPTSILIDNRPDIYGDYFVTLGLQRIKILDAEDGEERSVTLSLLPDEVEMLSIVSTQCELTFLGREKDILVRGSIRMATFNDVLEDLPTLQELRMKRRDDPPQGPKQLGSDMQAMEIPAEAIYSMPAGVRPGDRVDLITTFSEGYRNRQEPFTMLALQDVMILDVDDNSRGGITVAVTLDEAESLLLIQNQARFVIIAQNSAVDPDFLLKTSTLEYVLESLDLKVTPRDFGN